MNISEKIFELIKEKGMTQKEFARRTGIPQSTISDWKSKQLNPASDKILIICEVLETSPYELLGRAQGSKYATPDHISVQKDTEEYLLIERYRTLGKDQRERLQGYMEAIRKS
jgi:transcriptional regulator with XRE-family HTH domain